MTAEMRTPPARGAATRKWTFMVYLAGDNNLEDYGTKDLAEMKAAGASDQVAIVAQFDRMSDQVTRRYQLRPGTRLDTDCVMELPEVNTGDPAALIDFASWAARAFPAERYALVLWNHGAGWKDEDIYQGLARGGGAGRASGDAVRGPISRKARRALFRTTAEHLTTGQRAILFDDSSADFLDNAEMRWVMQRIVQRIGRPVDLLGFDACLMNMLEVGYQVRVKCRVVVGSQEVEPGDGWPYQAILSRLVKEPGMTPDALGRVIVEAYISAYRTKAPQQSVTQSAVDLMKIEPVAKAADRLAKALTHAMSDPATLGAVFGALRSTQSFTDRDYVDLGHLCRLLAASEHTNGVGTAARAVADLLTGPFSPVIAEGHHGAAVSNATGLSIYLPARNLSPLYAGLDFAKRYAWDEFLKAFTT